MLLEKVFFEGKEIILVGTAHISEESALLVKETIEKEKPDLVALELDLQRFKQLKNPGSWQQMNLNQVIAAGQTYLLLLNLLLASIQRQLGEKIGLKPGMEMLEALRVCEEKGVSIALIDRNISITLKRAISRMGFFEKFKFLYSVVLAVFGFGQETISVKKIEELKKKDIMSELMQKLGKEFPSVKEVLVDERDVFIASNLSRLDAKKIVAVVGAGHLEGIKKNIGKTADMNALNMVVEKKSVLRLAAFLVPVIFFALVGYAFFMKGFAATIYVLALWFITTGSLSALGVLIARGHILSALTALLAAPITTLHPLLAAGWFAGYVEAKVKSPKVVDFESLRNLNTFGDFAKNQVTRILLVVAFANLGAMAGTLIAFPVIVAIVS